MSDSIKLVFLGASTAVGEILEIVNALNTHGQYTIMGALDDNADLQGQSVFGIPVLGELAMAKTLTDAQFIFAIGSHKTRLLRLDILDKLDIPEERFITLIHPRANVYPSAKIGAGCIIHAGACIAQDADIGAFSIITFNAVIGGNVIMGKGAMVASLAFVGTGAKIGPCSFIGASSAVADNVVIGPGAMLGMATAAYRNVPKGLFVLGNPAEKVIPSVVPERICENWSY